MRGGFGARGDGEANISALRWFLPFLLEWSLRADECGGCKAYNRDGYV